MERRWVVYVLQAIASALVLVAVLALAFNPPKARVQRAADEIEQAPPPERLPPSLGILLVGGLLVGGTWFGVGWTTRRLLQVSSEPVREWAPTGKGKQAPPPGGPVRSIRVATPDPVQHLVQGEWYDPVKPVVDPFSVGVDVSHFEDDGKKKEDESG